MLLLGMCCAHAACLHTNTRHGRRTLSANRGAVFESLSEAQETSLLCLLAVQNHYTDTMIPDRPGFSHLCPTAHKLRLALRTPFYFLTLGEVKMYIYRRSQIWGYYKGFLTPNPTQL